MSYSSDDQINFSTDIIVTKKTNTYNITLGDKQVNIILSDYIVQCCEIVKKWYLCLNMLGKSTDFKNKNIVKIICCLLSDYHIIESINDKKIDLELYDVNLDNFVKIEIIDEKNKDIRLKLFNVKNIVVVFDCTNMNKYKFYELYDAKSIRSYYSTGQNNGIINFDNIVNDLNLKPKFVGDIDNLQNDFKTLSINNFKVNYGRMLCSLQNMMSAQTRIERQIQQEYKKLYMTFKKDNKF